MESSFEREIRERRELEKAVFSDNLRPDNEIVSESFLKCLDASEDKDSFLKGFGSDLQRRFPDGRWITSNGSRVFINNGKVIAGLDGFNKEIDKFFEGKKQSSGKGEGKQYKKGDSITNNGFKYKVSGVSEKTGKLAISMDYENMPKDRGQQKKYLESLKDLNNKVGIQIERNVDSGKKESLELSTSSRLNEREKRERFISQIETKGLDFWDEKTLNKYKELQSKQESKEKEVSGGNLYDKIVNKKETVTLKDTNGKEFQIKYAEGRSGVSKGFEMYRGGKKIGSYAMSKTEMHNYLSQFETKESKVETKQDKGGGKKTTKPKVNKDETPSLKTFEDMAIDAKDVNKLYKQIGEVKNVPASVSKEFFDKYNPTGKLTPMQTVQRLLNKVNNIPEQKPENKKEQAKPKANNTVQTKTIKEIESFGKQTLHNKKTETLSKLSNLASKIDEKYLSTKTKDKLNQLVEDLYINAYSGSKDEKVKELEQKLQRSTNIKDSLKTLTSLNKRLEKEDSYSLEKEDVNRIQEVLVEATKEQLQKKTTEKLNYKLF